MNVVGSTDAFSPMFPDDFLADIIGRLFVAWSRIPRPITEVLETRITKLLRHQYAYDPVIKQLPFQVRRELPIDDPTTGAELGRIDLCLLHGNCEDTYFAFECKRMNVTFPNGKFESLASDYVGSEGIGCFVSQQYACGHGHGGMIAYVFDSKIENAKDAIRRQLVKCAPQFALRSDPLIDSSLALKNQQLAETRHDIGGQAMTIFHCFLPLEYESGMLPKAQ